MKHIRSILLLFLISSTTVTIYAQVQVGARIIASEEGFAYGQNVQLSEDGKRLVVSGYGTSDQGVALFENINGDWVEQSFKAASDFPDSQTIYSVAMSSDGDKIAVGSVINTLDENIGNVKVFQYTDTVWSQKGNTIYGDFDGELFGRSLALSDDGNRVVVGARLNSRFANLGGRVAVYQFANNSWSQLGQSIHGTKDGIKIGSSVAISGDGAYIFMGSNSNYKANLTSLELYGGYTESRSLVDNNWVISDSRFGERFDHFGFAVTVSNNGEIFAATASQFKHKSGYVELYRNTNGMLAKFSTIYGFVGEYQGSSVALSGDGNKIVIGTVFPEDPIYTGSVRILEYDGESFVEIGKIRDDDSYPKFGISVDMSSDGNTIAVTSLDYDYNLAGTETGSVKVYDISELEIPEPPAMIDNEIYEIIIYPSPATNELNCANCEQISEWYIGDVTGKKVLSNQGVISNSIDISLLQTGVYYMYLINGAEDFQVKKFIKK